MKEDMKFIKSEKRFSTDELINDIESWPVHDGISDAIIARLRAADKLLGVAKKARLIISIYCKEHIKEYDKAITKYKEER